MQPQWVFDCLNARRKLPTEKYFHNFFTILIVFRYMPGVELPPHFSPFAKESAGDYVSIERIEELRNLGKGNTILLLQFRY